MKYKVGDKVRIVRNICAHGFDIGDIVIIESFKGEGVYSASSFEYPGEEWWVHEDDVDFFMELKLQKTPMDVVDKYYEDKVNLNPHGGPSSYYDMPFSEWITVNDQMEYLADKKWGKYGIHLKDIFKGLCRWGEKSGTTTEYDTRKIIYYGFRILRMLVGNKGVQKYLSELKEDPQFAEKES